MPLGNPIEAFIQAQQVKNQNRRDMYGDIAGLGQGLGETFGSIGSMIGEQKKKALIQQIVQAMQTQGTPQQGPQLPGQGMTPGMPPPASGMGGPTQDNTQQMKGLLMQADPQGMMGAMEGQMFPTPPTPLDPTVKALNQAKTAALNRGPQAKPTNPLDDAIKQKRLELMAILMQKAKMQSQPKPPNPVPGAALDVRTQIANNAQAPWWKKLGLGGGLKPVVNPLKGQSVPASSTADMSDEELMRLATQDDNQ